MWTGARRIAIFEVGEQSALFFDREVFSGLDGHAFANARRNFGFDLILQGCLIFFEIFHQRAQGSGRISAGKQGRDGPHLEGIRSESFHHEAEMLQER